MWPEISIAVGVAVVLGALALVPRRFEYWRYWTRGPFRWAMVAYLVLNGATGALGALLASLLDWYPAPESAFLRGLVYALAGQAVVRVQLRAFGAERVGGAATLLNSGFDRVSEWLDLVARDRIQRRLERQSDDDIAAYALYLYRRHVEPDPDIGQLQKRVYKTNLVKAGEGVAGDPGARGTLEEFCARELEERQLLGRDPLPDEP